MICYIICYIRDDNINPESERYLIMGKKKNRLWGFVNGEPFLLNGDTNQIPDDEPLFFGKVFITLGKNARQQVALENPPVPFSHLRDDHYIQIDDIVRVRGCHRRTIARHIDKGLLKVAQRVGGEYFFTVGEVRRWIKEVPDLKRGLRVRPRVGNTSEPVSGRSRPKKAGRA